MAYRVLFFAVVNLVARALSAQAPTVTVAPAEAVPGSIVRFTLVDTARVDSILAIRGSMAGEPLSFMGADSGQFRAIGAVPVDASDSVVATVVFDRRSGATDSIRVSVKVPHVTVVAEAPLAVDTQFTRPLDAKTQARIARENEQAREVGRDAHSAPPRWSAPFLRPRDTRITSGFGTGRMFNGTVASRHLGVDFAGDPGAPVHAANRGIVALVDTFFLAGRLVYIDHGGGVVTGYFHLSKPLVRKGDRVSRGQPIGLVGATGRVTGPHLHWSARYGALAVNPLDLLEVDQRAYSASLRVVSWRISRCSRQDALEAEATVEKLETWADLHAAFMRFAECDDGGIAEGWTDFVVRSLADRWSELAELRRLTDADSKFLAFVLSHVNESADEEDLARAKANARDRCPKGAAQLCKAIVTPPR
jgi:murein DD-endopeptidase MepM/ murein hydrolase activator NlpD